MVPVIRKAHPGHAEAGASVHGGGTIDTSPLADVETRACTVAECFDDRHGFPCKTHHRFRSGDPNMQGVLAVYTAKSSLRERASLE